MSVCNNSLVYRNGLSEVQVNPALYGKKIEGFWKTNLFTYIAYLFWGEHRLGYLGSGERKLREKYSIRVKEHSLIPKFFLRLFGWTRISYAQKNLWVNKRGLEEKRRIFSRKDVRVLTKTDKEVFSLFIRETQKFQTINENALYLQSKLNKISGNHFTLNKTAAIAKACLSHPGNQMRSVHGVAIFSKNVVVIPKKLIGKGTFKKVYKCTKLYLPSGKEEAAAFIKILDQNDIKGATKEGAILRTFRSCRQIVAPYDYSAIFGSAFYGVTKLYAGDLAHGKNLSYMDRLQIGIDIAEGLLEMDSKDYLHLDLKPQNILLFRRQGRNLIRAAVGDLGFAGKRGEEHLRAGTRVYQPPEILAAYYPIEGGKKFTKKERLPLLENADIWSVGLILCNLFCPEVYSDWKEKAMKVIDHTPLAQDIENLKIDEQKIEDAPIHRDVKEIIKKCLKSDPKDRCSMGEVKLALSKVLQSLKGK